MNYSKVENMYRIQSQFSRLKSLCDQHAVNDEILTDLGSLEKMVMGDAQEEGMPLSAKLSIYPLRQPSLSEAINEALEVLEAHHLKVIPGSMSTLILGDTAKLWPALQAVFSAAAARGELVMIVTLSNACPKPPDEACAEA